MPAPAAQLYQGITELSQFTFRIVIIPLLMKKTPFHCTLLQEYTPESFYIWLQVGVLNMVGQQPRIHCASAQERCDDKHFSPKLCISLSVLSHLGLLFSIDHRL